MAEECFSAGKRFGEALETAWRAANRMQYLGKDDTETALLLNAVKNMSHEISMHEDCLGEGDISDFNERKPEILQAVKTGDYKIAADELKDISEILD